VIGSQIPIRISKTPFRPYIPMLYEFLSLFDFKKPFLE
jgi:hypothetical protein